VDVPEELFVIVTKDAGPVAEWNIGLGSISSSGAAFASQYPDLYAEERDEWFPWLPNPDFQTFVGFHALRVSSDMRAEFNAEATRVRSFAGLPSRMACVFAWGSLDDALTARARMSGRFRGRILRCQPVSVLRSAVCNSAIVNFAQRAEKRGFFTDPAAVDLVWRTYWSGSGEQLTLERQNLLTPGGPPETVDMSREPLWEWLIDGRLQVLDVAAPD
jgi:hypothetical protein